MKALTLGSALVLLQACSGTRPHLSASEGAASTETGDTAAASGPGDESGPVEESGATGLPSSDGGGSSDDDGEQFVPPPSEGDGCAVERGGCKLCDIWDEEDCDQFEKCTAWDHNGMGIWNENKCVELMGDGNAGDACMVPNLNASGEDDCGAGSLCWDPDPDTHLGYCVSFCTGSPEDPQCEGDTLCIIYNDGVLPLCLTMCDPLAGGGDCPGADNLCIPHPEEAGFVCALDASEGMGVDGIECEDSSSCNQGLFCASINDLSDCQGSDGCCSPYCDLTDMNPHAPCTGQGEECVPWFEGGMAPAGYDHVGGCMLPP